MKIQFSAEDGTLLSGQLLAAEQPKALVLLNPGTATPMRYYLPFAGFLASQGFSVFLWNYRGFDESRQGSLAGSAIEFTDVGQHDMPAAIARAKELAGDLPLYCIGHSAGGQQIGFAHNVNLLEGMLAVAVSTGYTGSMPLGYRLKAHFFFKLLGPVSSRLVGYVAAKRLGIMEDLPAGLVKEWGRWCSKPDFFFDPLFARDKPHLAGYRTLKFPVHVLTADDDEISTEFNTRSLWKHIRTQTPVEFVRYRAAEAPGGHIGHFGYFRRSHPQIWQDMLERLQGFMTDDK